MPTNGTKIDAQLSIITHFLRFKRSMSDSSVFKHFLLMKYKNLPGCWYGLNVQGISFCAISGYLSLNMRKSL